MRERERGIKQAMMSDQGGASNKPPKRAKVVQAIGDMSPEDRVKHEAAEAKKRATDAFRVALKALKNSAEEAKREMMAAKESAKAATSKGFPAAMQQFYEDAFDPCLQSAEQTLSEWATAATFDLEVAGTEDIAQKREDVEALTATMDQELKQLGAKVKDVKELAK